MENAQSASVIKNRYVAGVRFDVLEEHLEEVNFLFAQRELLLTSPRHTLNDLNACEQRLLAHLDGLLIGESEVYKLLLPKFIQGEVGEVFAAAYIVLATSDATWLDLLARMYFDKAQGPVLDGLAAALRLTPHTANVSTVIAPWFQVSRAELRAISLNILRFRHDLSVVQLNAAITMRSVDHWIQKALYDPSAVVQARACRTVGELGRADLVPQLQALHSSKDEAVAFWSCWSAALLGDLSAVTALKRFAVVPAYTDDALAVALRRLSPQAAGQWLEELAQDEVNVRLVIQGVGIAGDPVFVPGLISSMSMPELARIAADSFCTITGISLADAKLEATPPPVNDDDPVQTDPDDELPWPDSQRVFEWWQSNGARYERGVRYLLGRPVTPEHLQWVLRYGNQKQRYGAALDLAMLNPGTPLFATDAPGILQLQRLGR